MTRPKGEKDDCPICGHNPWTKRVTKSTAMSVFGLYDANLKGLNVRYVKNPHYRSAADVNLFRVCDLLKVFPIFPILGPSWPQPISLQRTYTSKKGGILGLLKQREKREENKKILAEKRREEARIAREQRIKEEKAWVEELKVYFKENEEEFNEASLPSHLKHPAGNSKEKCWTTL